MKKTLLITILTLTYPIHAIAQSSTNYILQEYGFGSTGTDESRSTNYGILGIVGEQSSEKQQSTNFAAMPGLTFTHFANVPPAPTVTNPANYYNKLSITIHTGNNPSDTKYAISVSTDNFVNDIKYIQNDQTIGQTLGSEDWQTYTNWGGASGFNVIGLTPATTYSFRTAAQQGNYTQTPYGPIATASTVNPQLSFDIDIAPTDTETNPPYTVQLGALTTNSATTANDKIWIDLSTNAESGGTIYIYSNTTGLISATTNYTISSTTGNLASLNEGFGARADNTTQTQGGPLTKIPPYNNTGDTVGIIDTTIRKIFDTSSQPITNARGSILIKARANTVTPAATDYTTTLYVIAAGNF